MHSHLSTERAFLNDCLNHNQNSAILRTKISTVTSSIYYSRYGNVGPQADQMPLSNVALAAVFEMWVRVLMPLKTHRVDNLMHLKLVVAQSPHVGVTWKLREGGIVQTSSSSPDRCSKLRDPLSTLLLLPEVQR
ncbi:hypothetical protein TNCV_3718941 [Trichonephila clavipes]|nr:hypothetical protein TNCV_3718941 [Trichonephila clavipes]